MATKGCDWFVLITNAAIVWHISMRSKWHARKLYFFVMATRAKRTKFTAEEVLVQMENENEFNSDHGGVLSGKKSVEESS